MKHVIITIIACFRAFLSISQPTGNGEKIMTQIADLYNKEAYKEMYQMHASDFKAKLSEEQLTAFYKSGIRPTYGKIVIWVPDENKDAAIRYRVQFEKGVLDLVFYLNLNNEITGLEWKPASNKTETGTKKRDVSNLRTSNPKHTRLQQLADSLAMDYLQNPYTCGLSIGIINGDNIESYFYGQNNRDVDEMPDARTLYEIGSVTKTFTGILLAHAINDGKIKATDDIRQYLPGSYPRLKYKSTPITVENLSNHTSGLPRLPADLDKQPAYDPTDPYKNYSKEMMYGYLKKVKVPVLPAPSSYSNYGAALLGLILENVYQQTYEDLVKAYILEPAKMTNTKFTLSEKDQWRMAKGYSGTDSAEVHYWDPGAFIGAGGLKSDMEDMLLYLRANMKEINNDFKLSHGLTYKDTTIAVGLNWMISTTHDGQTLIWHNGATAGFTSFCGYLKEKKAGVVILSNSGTSVDNVAINMLKELNK